MPRGTNNFTGSVSTPTDVSHHYFVSYTPADLLLHGVATTHTFMFMFAVTCSKGLLDAGNAKVRRSSVCSRGQASHTLGRDCSMRQLVVCLALSNENSAWSVMRSLKCKLWACHVMTNRPPTAPCSKKKNVRPIFLCRCSFNANRSNFCMCFSDVRTTVYARSMELLAWTHSVVLTVCE